MPIYEYQCDECGHMFEKLKKRSDPEPQECPECGESEPRRVISQTGFQLKGSGWYVTDYKSPKAAKPASSESKAGSEAGGDTGGDSGGDAAKTDDSSSSSSESSSGNDSTDPAPAKQEVA